MVEILIKGMEMPKEVNHPLFIRILSDGHIAKGDFLKGGFIETEAKAVALPEHGRLGDLDALGKLVFERKEKARDRGDWGVADGYMYAKELVDDAPIIIEASKERK